MATYRSYLFQVVVSVIGDLKLAEDITQEVFVNIYYSFPEYRFQGLKTWMTRIAVNRAIDAKRQLARRREEPVDLQSQASCSDMPSGFNVERIVVDRERRRRVQARLQSLPDTYREVVVAYYLEEKSYQEIADKLRAPVKTVESKLYRAKQWMRKHWEEEEFR